MKSESILDVIRAIGSEQLPTVVLQECADPVSPVHYSYYQSWFDAQWSSFNLVEMCKNYTSSKEKK